MSETTENPGIFQVTKPVTGTFFNIVEAKSVTRNGKPTGDPKFSANAEFEPDHPGLAALKAKLMEVAKAKWPNRNFAAEARTSITIKNDDGTEEIIKRIPTFVFPITSGTKLADDAKAKGKDREFSRGKAVVTSRSKYRPNLAVLVGGKLIDLDSDEAVKANARAFYSGVQCLFEFNVVAYEGVGETGADGVTAYLNKIVSLNSGTKVAGGGQSAAEVFKSYVGSNSDVDPTAGLDDEIPF